MLQDLRHQSPIAEQDLNICEVLRALCSYWKHLSSQLKQWEHRASMFTWETCMAQCDTAPGGVNRLTEEQVCEGWKSCTFGWIKKKTGLTEEAEQPCLSLTWQDGSKKDRRKLHFQLFMRKQAHCDRMGSRTESISAAERWRPGILWKRATVNMHSLARTAPGRVYVYICMYIWDSQSLDASNDGVEGSLNIGSRAGGHNGLGLFMEQLSYILHRNTHERETMS